MRKLILLAGAAILSAGVPAAAQYGPARPYYGTYPTRIEAVASRLEAEIRAGRVTRYEAQNLRAELRALRQTERRYRAGGYSRAEGLHLSRLLQRLERAISDAARTGGYRNPYYDRDRDGDDDRFDRDDDNFDDRFDRDADGDDDRFDRDDDNRDDRFDRDADGDDDRFDRDDDDRDDRYERPWDDDGPRYRMGDTLPPGYSYYPVPPEYQYRYRDTPYVYYRYHGYSIYEIDRRTGRIIRVIELR